MHYSDSNSQNNELLRLVLPFLAKHKLPANPIAYNVCYEYISHSNKAVRNAIDAKLENGQELTNEFMIALFEKYISSRDELNLRRINDKIKSIINNLANATTSADHEATRFIQSLIHYSDSLGGKHDEFAIEKIVKSLLSDTHSMQTATSHMQAQLDEHKNEINILRAQLDQLREEILIDALTGLSNRKGLEQKIEKALSKQKTSTDSCCVLMIDIDHFKNINDTYGHLIGDKVIRFVADTLKKQVRGNDTVTRFGGDEFLVLLPNTSVSGALSVAENIRSAIEKTRIKRLETGEFIGHITVSIGGARYLLGESVNELISRADAALYKSKHRGRNRVTIDECDVIALKTTRA